MPHCGSCRADAGPGHGPAGRRLLHADTVHDDPPFVFPTADLGKMHAHQMKPRITAWAVHATWQWDLLPGAGTMIGPRPSHEV